LLPLLKKKGSSVFLVLFRQEEQGIGPYAVRLLLSHLYMKSNNLPRQARDKHREISKKGALFSVPFCPEPVLANHPLLPCLNTTTKPKAN